MDVAQLFLPFKSLASRIAVTVGYMLAAISCRLLGYFKNECYFSPTFFCLQGGMLHRFVWTCLELMSCWFCEYLIDIGAAYWQA
jgi:hypothetical protein